MKKAQGNQKGGQQKKIMDANQIKQLFNKLSKGKPTMSDEDLFEFLLNDLGMKGDDPLFGHIATNVMNISKIQNIHLENIQALVKYTQASCVQDIRESVNAGKIKDQLKSNQTYKIMYRKLFDLYCGKYTTLDFDIAEQLWQCYLKNKLAFYNQFFQYLESLPDKPKVYRDTWNMLFDFSNEVKSLNQYKQEDGWPILIDGFVQFLKKK